MPTQLELAKNGTISDVVKFVAGSENVSAELVRDELAAGRLVIPANKIHLENNLKPAGIGRALTTKVNANIGTSSVSSSIDRELEKMKTALEVGADAIMDLSTGDNLDRTRQNLIEQCYAPFGTVPIYQAIESKNIEDIKDPYSWVDCV